MKPKLMLLLLLPLMAAGGCATVPTGPSVRVLPGTGKTFEQFQADDAVCRQWADQHVGQSSQETVNQNTATGAAVGTLGGAALGAIFGAASGHAGTGAAIGTGSGLLLGTIAGANARRTVWRHSVVTTWPTSSVCMPRAIRFRGEWRRLLPRRWRHPRQRHGSLFKQRRGSSTRPRSASMSPWIPRMTSSITTGGTFSGATDSGTIHPTPTARGLW